MISDDDMHKAIGRIARSEDGHALYLFLQKALCAVTSIGTSDCALPRNEGRRSFAADLMGLMAKGIQESDRTGNAAITFAVNGPRPIGRSGGAGRRVTLDTAVSGYDGPDGPRDIDG